MKFQDIFIAMGLVGAMLAMPACATTPPVEHNIPCTAMSHTDICSDGYVKGLVDLGEGKSVYVTVVDGDAELLVAFIYQKKVIVVYKGKRTEAGHLYLKVAKSGLYKSSTGEDVILSGNGILLGTDEAGENLYYFPTGELKEVNLHD